jgi:hypothetical protein
MSNKRVTPLYRIMFEAMDSRRGLRSLYTVAFQRALPDAVLLFERIRMVTGEIDLLVTALEASMGKEAAKTYIDHKLKTATSNSLTSVGSRDVVEAYYKTRISVVVSGDLVDRV